MLRELQAQDLLKYGLIPEFVGRLPITVALDYLDEEDIIRILTEPKNAFVKQYQKFFALDDVELVFHEGASAGNRRARACARHGRSRAQVDHRGRAAQQHVRGAEPS